MSKTTVQRKSMKQKTVNFAMYTQWAYLLKRLISLTISRWNCWMKPCCWNKCSEI